MNIIEWTFISIGIFYFVYTLLFAIEFNKTNISYSKDQKSAHNILIWLVPFLWVYILKYLDKPVRDRNVIKRYDEYGEDTDSNSTQYIDGGYSNTSMDFDGGVSDGND